MANTFHKLRDLLNPAAPLLVGTVTAHHTDGTATVALAGGGSLRVRGTGVAVGQRAFIQSGELRSQAPALDSVTIIVY